MRLPYAEARLHSALAPLTALGITGIWFTLVGVADLLVAGGWVVLSGGLGLGAFALVQKRSEARRLLSPGAVVFWGLAISFAVYFPSASPCSTSSTSSASGARRHR